MGHIGQAAAPPQAPRSGRILNATKGKRTRVALIVALLSPFCHAALADELDDRQTAWKTCIDNKAVAFASSAEIAREVARIAAIACRVHRHAYERLIDSPGPLSNIESKKQAADIAGEVEAFFIEAATLLVLETRLKAK